MADSQNETKDDSDATNADSPSADASQSSDTTSQAATERAGEQSSGVSAQSADAEASGEPSSEMSGEPSTTVAPATAQSSATQSALAPSAPSKEDRSDWLSSMSKTFKYVNTISRDKSLHFRTSDTTTTKLLIGALFVALIFAAFPFFDMAAAAAICYVVADVMLFLAILIFVVSRFGIIRAMEPRHALVCWHLMVGTGLLALVAGFNLISIVAIIYLRDKLPSILGGG